MLKMNKYLNKPYRSTARRNVLGAESFNKTLRAQDSYEIEEVFKRHSRKERINAVKNSRSHGGSVPGREIGQNVASNSITRHFDQYEKVIGQCGCDSNLNDNKFYTDPLSTKQNFNTRAISASLDDAIYRVDNKATSFNFSDFIQKVDNVSQYYADDADIKFSTTDNTPTLEEYLNKDECCDPMPQEIHIAETPRIRVIAEKFYKFKRNNLELRKLDERIVCVEYDVHDRPVEESAKPVQIMRAYFTVKPKDNEGDIGKDNSLMKAIPSNLRNEMNTTEDGSPYRKEIEIIDKNSAENRTYLEDLKRMVKRNQAANIRRNKTKPLDLTFLYQIAMKERVPHEETSSSNILSKSELDVIKELILNKRISSVHRFNRKKVRYDDSSTPYNCTNISNSFVTEILDESNKTY